METHPHRETEIDRFEIVTWDQNRNKAPGIRLFGLKKPQNSFEVKHILVLKSFHGRNSCVFLPRLQAEFQHRLFPLKK